MDKIMVRAVMPNEKGQAPRTKKGSRAELARRLRTQPE
jgi:hypothetical protein